MRSRSSISSIKQSMGSLRRDLIELVNKEIDCFKKSAEMLVSNDHAQV